MIVEIRKAGFVNKGAELMLLSILTKLRETYPDAKVTMAPTPSGGDQPFDRIVAHGMYPKAWLWSHGYQVGDLAGLLPEPFRQRYGLVLDREVDVVLDASGFAYGDAWGDSALQEFARCARRWKKRGTALVVLPQALGPFTGPGMRRCLEDVVSAADLVFPRDKTSYEHVIDAVGEQEKIQRAPDFTNLLGGCVPHGFDPGRHRFCVVPNYRMIDKTDARDSDAYLPFMQKCIAYARDRGAGPFLLVHEGESDRKLAEQLARDAGGLDVLTVNDPLSIKGMLGSCTATLGSRYHGLVSALSQGVPAMATGWSFKYRELFEDYDFPEGMLDLSLGEDELYAKLDLLIDPSQRQVLADRLHARAQPLKDASEEMWRRVLQVMDPRAYGDRNNNVR